MFCQDGVVIGADSAITHVIGTGGHHTIERHGFRKVDIVRNTILAGTGTVGHHQRFHELVKEKIPEAKKGNKVKLCTELAGRAVDDFRKTWVPGQPLPYGAVVGFPIGDRPVLCEYTVGSFHPEVKDTENWYCSMGNAQAITDSLLAFFADVFWSEKQPTVYHAVLAAVWTLSHIVKYNAGGIGGDLQIAVLKRGKKSGSQVWQANRLTSDDLNEHREWIEGATDSLQKHINQLLAEEDPPPKP